MITIKAKAKNDPGRIKNQLTGKVLYALLFLVVLPVGLWYWAQLASPVVTWPGIQKPDWGISLVITGFIVILTSMWALFYYGKGLPMNAYPPEKYVSKGPYRIFNHPIYVGFALVLIGASLYTGSASMLWLVTPATILGMVALVLGFEQLDLKDRFRGELHSSLFSLPANSTAEPTLLKKAAMAVLVMLIVLAGNLIIATLTTPRPIAESASYLFDNNSVTIFIIILSIAGVYLVPFLVKESFLLRHWTIASIAAVLLILYISLLLPDAAGISYVIAGDFRLASASRANLWSIAMVIPGVSGLLISFYTLVKTNPRAKLIIGAMYSVLLLLILSICLDSWIQLVSGLVISVISFNLLPIWKWILVLSEKIANSWHETILGNVRIINHGIYVGMGAFFGSLLIGVLAGEENMWGIVIFAITVTVCSALWAQIIEGSNKLKRPFGFYGALIGIIFAGLLVWYLGYDVWAIIGATSVAMPWIQGIGRLRCLINGCCHGSVISNSELGIRYYHHRSRVVTISELKGKPLHPTPVYSIAWLFFTGFILLVMWRSELSPALIFGMYLILNGLGRFVEEAYRGEVQTPSANKLRLYQWTAIASVVAGIVMTCIPLPFPELSHQFSWNIPLGALIIGLFTFFSMGVDFPNSNARFSRLV